MYLYLFYSQYSVVDSLWLNKKPPSTFLWHCVYNCCYSFTVWIQHLVLLLLPQNFFSDTITRFNATFCGKIHMAIHHFSRHLFPVFHNFGVLDMGPYESPKIHSAAPPAELFLTILLWQSSQKLLLGILKFKVCFLKKNEIFVNMRPYGSENFKMPFLLQIWFPFKQTFSEYSLYVIVLTVIVANGKMKNCQYFENGWS